MVTTDILYELVIALSNCTLADLPLTTTTYGLSTIHALQTTTTDKQTTHRSTKDST